VDHLIAGPDSMTVAHLAFPTNLPKMPFMIHLDHAPQGNQGGWAGMPYKLYADGAMIKNGVIDGEGPLHVAHEVTTKKYRLDLANGVSYDIPVANDYTNPEQGVTANQGIHRHQAGQPSETEVTPVPSTVREDYAKVLSGSETGEH
jgi:type VI secretion system secreted protein VgrG